MTTDQRLLALIGRRLPAIFDVIPRGPQGFSLQDRVSAVALNPQPLPPGPPDPEGISVARPGASVFLNPQPLPPKELFTPFAVLSGQTGSSFVHSIQQPTIAALLVTKVLR